MGFQEKMAWAMMIILIITGAAYYSIVFQASAALDTVAPPILPLLIGYVIFLVVLITISAILISLTRPSEANAGLDERDKLIQFKGEAWSGRAMGFLIICALLDFGIYGDGNRLFHAVFASLIVSHPSAVEQDLQSVFGDL
ncbi:MAG: hypothetical protein AAFQ04_12060 [Pseudomonadota bacterium]